MNASDQSLQRLVGLRWYCGCYVGEPKWQNSEDFEPDECGAEFDTREHDEESWAEGICSTTCPECGAELTQKHDAPVLLSNAVVSNTGANTKT
jgi:hypothetical protein